MLLKRFHQQLENQRWGRRQLQQTQTSKFSGARLAGISELYVAGWPHKLPPSREKL